MVVDAFSVVAVVCGLFFAGLELRQFRKSRERESALELLNTIQTPEFIKGLLAITQVPDDVSREQAEKLMGEGMESLYVVGASLEGLGALVYRREISLEMVMDFFSGPIIVIWMKLRRLIKEEREVIGRETWAEWVQWLAERVIEREELEGNVPAYIAHKDWRPR
jgi:hypothetical protein